MVTKSLRKTDRSTINACPVLKSIPDAVRRELFDDERCLLIDAPRGRCLDGYGACIALILKGRLRVSKRENPAYTMRMLRRGDIFGAATLFDGDGDASVSVIIAEDDSRLLIFPLALLREKAEKYPALKDEYIKFLTSRIKLLNGKIETLVCVDRDRALANYILGKAAPGEHSCTVSLGPLVSVASELNIGRASLYRSFDSLEKLGLIEKNGRSVRIPDTEALRKFYLPEAEK